MKHDVGLYKALQGSPGVSGDLVEAACRRLGLASLLVAGLALVGLIFQVTLVPWLFGREPTVALGLSVAGLGALSFGMFLLSHGERFSPRTVLNLGVVYELVICLAFSIVEVTHRFDPNEALWRVSWVAVLVMFFPFLVPMAPAKRCATVLAAASTGPFAFGVAVAIGYRTMELGDIARLYLSNYVAAAMALVPAFVLHRLGRQVEEARELGSYRLLEELGHGGMGEVWRAEHRMLARPAAIKLIRSEALERGTGEDREDLLRRFEIEAQATAALESPHSVELYDFGLADDGTFYYVMELLEGLDMESLVERFGPLPPERAAYLLGQVCDSLAEAHRRGLVHRDVKPANLFVCRRGLLTDFVKVLDFGLAQWHGLPGNDGPGPALAPQTSGTPAYMAPETVLGAAEVDARSDLYAVGCVAYRLLTGQFVFAGESTPEMLTHHVKTEPEPPSQASEEEIPEDLDRIVLACLAKDPGERPQSAHELKQRLDACELPERWTAERADAWWRSHLPEVILKEGRRS